MWREKNERNIQTETSKSQGKNHLTWPVYGGSASTGRPFAPNEIGKLTSDHLQNPKQNFALNQTSSHSYSSLCNWSFSDKVLLDATEVHKDS